MHLFWRSNPDALWERWQWTELPETTSAASKDGPLFINDHVFSHQRSSSTPLLPPLSPPLPCVSLSSLWICCGSTFVNYRRFKVLTCFPFTRQATPQANVVKLILTRQRNFGEIVKNHFFPSSYTCVEIIIVMVCRWVERVVNDIMIKEQSPRA